MDEKLIDAAIAHQKQFKTSGEESCISGYINGKYAQSRPSFLAGAEWQKKRSLWININERLPENKDEVLVLSRMNRSGKYFVAEDSYNGEEWEVSSTMYYTRIAWMPIPSFDEILEANKDVLERIKEKGG